MIATEAPQQNFVLDVDGIYRHKSVPLVRKRAIAMTNEAMKASDVREILKETMDKIQNKENWKNPASTLVTTKPDAIITAAAFIFYHGGVEITTDAKGKSWGIYSKGYYHYCG
ncbi:MAG: hypothetical protein PHF76_12565 [Bacteroidales bacterium]|nr:hypothetical protein [Bacteroidales bacterium]